MTGSPSRSAGCTIANYTGKRSRHTDFFYSRAGRFDISAIDQNGVITTNGGYSYILVVDGDWNWKTWLHKHRIRKAMKLKIAEILKMPPERVAVRYRLYNSSFG